MLKEDLDKRNHQIQKEMKEYELVLEEVEKFKVDCHMNMSAFLFLGHIAFLAILVNL